MNVSNDNVSLEHHFPDGGGHGFPGAVVPDELGVLVRALEDVHRRLRVVPHGVHEDPGQEAHQGQTNLRDESGTCQSNTRWRRLR